MYNAVMHEQHQQNRDNLDICLESLQRLPDLSAQSQLWKFYNNARIKWTEMDREFVQCRRVKRLTPKYLDLEAQYNESITVFNQYHMIAILVS
jgi:hypothetical protein